MTKLIIYHILHWCSLPYNHLVNCPFMRIMNNDALLDERGKAVKILHLIG